MEDHLLIQHAGQLWEFKNIMLLPTQRISDYLTPTPFMASFNQSGLFS